MPLPDLLAPPPPIPSLTPFWWAALAVGCFVAATLLLDGGQPHLWLGLVVLVAQASHRTWRPLRPGPAATVRVPILVDAAITTAVVVGTGAWASPFTFSLVPSVLQAGFIRGARHAVRLSAVITVIVSASHLLDSDDVWVTWRDIAAWTSVLCVIALLSGYAREVSAVSARQQTIALDRLSQLVEANALLSSLHRVAQTLPASLDLEEVIDSTITRLRDLVPCDSVTLLLYDAPTRAWVPARRRGEALLERIPTTRLPPPMRRAAGSRRVLNVPNLAMAGPGSKPGAASGIYAALRAREHVVGLLAVEADEAARFTTRDAEVMAGIIEPFGTALDNARLFAQLRSMGADEERSRIARELHDQIGQALASVTFELDRAVRASDRGDDVRPMLDELRTQVRGTVREVREALFDLRSDVSSSQDLVATLEAFLRRVEKRSGLQVAFEHRVTQRLPLRLERELWRIAQEAVRNVERHAGASRLRVRLRVSAGRATMEIVDNGKGFQLGDGRLDSYGLLGMHERASGIGAALEFDSAVGRGTTVRVSLAPEGGTP